MQIKGVYNPQFRLQNHGIQNINAVCWNLSTPMLYGEAIRRHEGRPDIGLLGEKIERHACPVILSVTSVVFQMLKEGSEAVMGTSSGSIPSKGAL